MIRIPALPNTVEISLRTHVCSEKDLYSTWRSDANERRDTTQILLGIGQDTNVPDEADRRSRSYAAEVGHTEGRGS
jgi:hypothetical protein